MKTPRRTGKAAHKEKEEDSGSRSVRRALDIFELMLQRGELAHAIAYVAASVFGGVLLLFAGLWLMRGLPA